MHASQDNKLCDGWIFTNFQTISTRAPCKMGNPCCWLKAGVETIAPLQNCTAGFMRKRSQAGTWEVEGGAMLGETTGGQNDTAAIWLHNAAHTWHAQHLPAATQLVGPVDLILPFSPGKRVTLSLVDTYTGDITSNSSLTTGADGLHLHFPPFTRDVAAIVTLKSDDNQPAPDAPYVEIVPQRYTFQNTTAVAGWGVIPADCCIAQVLPTKLGTLLLSDHGGLLLAREPAKAGGYRTFAHVTGSVIPAGSRVALRDESHGVVATPSGLAELSCALTRATCTMGKLTAASFGAVAAVQALPSAVFVAAAKGLFRCAATSCEQLLGSDRTEAPMTALAAHGPSDKVAAGSADKVWLFATDGSLLRWEWATAICGPDAGSGGVLDGPVTALAFDAAGDLFAGNDIALNIRSAATGTWSRVSGDMGLPFANITALVVDYHDPVTGAAQWWLGSSRGLSLHSADPAADPQWRYFYGARWHPGTRVTAMARMINSSTIVAATDGGLTVLESQVFTLEKKAALMQAKLKRHDRHGLVAGCPLSAFGDVSTAHCVDDDNNVSDLPFVHEMVALSNPKRIAISGPLDIVRRRRRALSLRRHQRSSRCSECRALPRWHATASQHQRRPRPLRALGLCSVRRRLRTGTWHAPTVVRRGRDAWLLRLARAARVWRAVAQLERGCVRRLGLEVGHVI